MRISLNWTTYESPIGPLTAVAGPKGLRSLVFPGEARGLAEADRRPMPALAEQLDAYFAGSGEGFDLNLDLRGPPLQKLVWAQLLEIPYGETSTYGEVAARIEAAAYPVGLEEYRRPRAVGAAIGENPVAIAVPCHRVIGANGSLTGYRGGLDRKQRLLELEGATVRGSVLVSEPAEPQLELL